MRRRRDTEVISIAFLDVITSGFGAIILLLALTKFGNPPPPGASEDPRFAEISALQRTLFAKQREARELAAAVDATDQQIAAAAARARDLAQKLAAATSHAEAARTAAAHNAEVAGQLRVAQEQLSAEMKRLYQQRDRIRTDLVGGIPIDSEYIIFVIDTSGSMFRYAWPKVMDQIIETLYVYPHVKGIQVMSDQGSYMFPQYRGQWIPDTPERRAQIIDRMPSWNPFSKSSPAEGIEAAVGTYYNPDKKISIYVYGDEFTGRSIRQVVDYVSKLNHKDPHGAPFVRIHAIGFPTQFANPPHLQETGVRFAALMRDLTRDNGGTFVGLNSFR